MIAHGEGVSTITILSSDICDINSVTQDPDIGNFSDLVLLTSNLGYGTHQPRNGSFTDAVVKFELSHFVSWGMIDTELCYLRSGHHISKDKNNMTIAYPIGVDQIKVINNPSDKDYKQTLAIRVGYQIHDFFLVDNYNLLVCGVQGEVSIHSYDLEVKKRDLVYFKLNLEKNETVQLVDKSPEEDLVIIVVSRFSSLSRLLLYSYKHGEMSYVTEWRVEESLMGLEERKQIQKLEYLKEGDDLIVVGIEQGFDANMRIWNLQQTKIEQIGYAQGCFMDKYVDSKVYMNSLWTLEENGILRCTQVSSLTGN